MVRKKDIIVKDDQESIKIQVSNFIESTGLDNITISNKTGLSRKTTENLRNGFFIPSFESLIVLRKTLNLDINEIVDSLPSNLENKKAKQKSAVINIEIPQKIQEMLHEDASIQINLLCRKKEENENENT